MLIEKLNPLRDPDWLASFKDKDCLARNVAHSCSGDVVGHHLKLGWYGKGIKPDDRHTVALCDGHHRTLQQQPERAFWVMVFNESPHALTEVLRGYAGLKYEEWKRETESAR